MSVSQWLASVTSIANQRNTPISEVSGAYWDAGMEGTLGAYFDERYCRIDDNRGSKMRFRSRAQHWYREPVLAIDTVGNAMGGPDRRTHTDSSRIQPPPARRLGQRGMQ